MDHEQHAADARLYRKAIKWVLQHYRRRNPIEGAGSLWVDECGQRAYPPIEVDAILSVVEREVGLRAEYAG
jgi:hypothetical protein